MPGGPLVRRVPGGLRADRVVRDGHSRTSPGRRRWRLPSVPRRGGRPAGGHRAESVDRPGGAGLGGVLAEPPGAVVHHRGDLGQVGLAAGVGRARYSSGPASLRLRGERVDPRADPGVQDGGDVPGAGQVSFGDGRADDLGGIQAGQFGGVQGAEQPAGLVRERLPVAGRERGHDQLAVAVVAGSFGFGGPDRVEDGQVVGVGEVALPDRGGGKLGAVAAEDVGEHGDGWRGSAPPGLPGRNWLGGVPRVRGGGGRSGRVRVPGGCRAAGRRAARGW